MKKGVVLVVLAAFVVMAFGAVVVAQDGMKTIKQPAEMWPKGKLTKSTAETGVSFNHDKHGADFGCVTCHHKSEQAKIDAGEKPKSCFECHGPAADGDKLDTQKMIHDKAKGKCLACHKEKGGNAPTKCTDCHPK